MRKTFSQAWKRSAQPRKQRKHRHRAPLHERQKAVHAHLSPELRKKHARRSLQLRTGDKVKVLRGQFAGKEGNVERVLLRTSKVIVTGMEDYKKEGSKHSIPLVPSVLMITELKTGDKYRAQKLEHRVQKP